MLQLAHPSSSCQNAVSKIDYSSADRFWKGEDSFQIRNATENGPEQEPLPHPTVVDRSQANAEHTLPNSEQPENILQGTGGQNHSPKMANEILSLLPSYQDEMLQNNPQISPTKMSSPDHAPADRKEIVNIKERKNEQEEDEPQELLSKLLDAFNLETTSGKIS
jgi:hypothetical protein